MTAFQIPRRPYKKGGPSISVAGFGGILVMHAEQPDANRRVAEAVEQGVDYFDVAPGYEDAEEKLGPALAPYRQEAFLACKTGERSRQAAEKDFNRSLQRLRTDYLDLYQLHALTQPEDVEQAFAADGVMQLVEKEKAAGRIRYAGFSAHSEEAALMAMDRYDFDSVLFPLSFASYLKNGFGKKVLEKASEKSMAVLALKSTAWRTWPENHPDQERLKAWYQPIMEDHLRERAVRYILHLPGVVAAVSGGDAEFFPPFLEIVRAKLTPLAPDQEAELRQTAHSVEAPLFDGRRHF